MRHTLHKIITVVHFIDMRGHSLLAVKLNHTNDDEEDGRDEEESIGSFDLFVYECESEVSKLATFYGFGLAHFSVKV